MENDIKYCKNCNCMTHTKKGYIYICAKCGKDRRGQVVGIVRLILKNGK